MTGREFRDVSAVRAFLLAARRELGDGRVDAGEVLDLLDRAERRDLPPSARYRVEQGTTAWRVVDGHDQDRVVRETRHAMQAAIVADQLNHGESS